MFQKLDIKDGYWRSVVADTDKWNFCYVLPKLTPKEPTQIVVPKCLQMGWAESPAYFCSASETARDVSETLLHLPIGSFPAHKLEELTMSDYSNKLNNLKSHTLMYPSPKGPTWLPPSLSLIHI